MEITNYSNLSKTKLNSKQSLTLLNQMKLTTRTEFSSRKSLKSTALNTKINFNNAKVKSSEEGKEGKEGNSRQLNITNTKQTFTNKAKTNQKESKVEVILKEKDKEPMLVNEKEKEKQEKYEKIDKLDRLDNVIFLRKQLREDYSKINSSNIHEIKGKIIKKWKDIIVKLLQVDCKTALYSLKTLGDILIEFDEHDHSRYFFMYLKYISSHLELLEELMISYECMGTISKHQFKYEEAIVNFKKQIEIAWILNDHVSELRAYDNIGLQYFYLANHKKAKYYHMRFIYGKYEKETELKKRVKDDFYEKNFNFFDIPNEKGEYKPKTINTSTLIIGISNYLSVFERGNNFLLNFTEKQEREREDYSKEVPDSVKIGEIEKSDISFNLILTSNDEDDEDEENKEDEFVEEKPLNQVSKVSKARIPFEKVGKRKEKLGKFKKRGENQKGTVQIEDNLTQKEDENNIILSHLSLKRKEYLIERFDAIFIGFDRKVKDLKKVLSV